MASSTVIHSKQPKAKARPLVPNGNCKPSKVSTKFDEFSEDEFKGEISDDNVDADGDDGDNDEAYDEGDDIEGINEKKKARSKKRTTQRKEKNTQEKKRKKINFKEKDLVVFWDESGHSSFGSVCAVEDGAPFMLVQIFNKMSQENAYRLSETVKRAPVTDGAHAVLYPRSDMKYNRMLNIYIASYCPFEYLQQNSKKSNLTEHALDTAPFDSSYSLKSRVQIIQSSDLDESNFYLVGEIGVIEEIGDGWLCVQFPNASEFWFPESCISEVLEGRASSSSSTISPLEKSAATKSEKQQHSNRYPDQEEITVRRKGIQNVIPL
jgi:hypothetical protein